MGKQHTVPVASLPSGHLRDMLIYFNKPSFTNRSVEVFSKMRVSVAEEKAEL